MTAGAVLPDHPPADLEEAPESEAELAVLERQVLYSHWRSNEERRQFTRSALKRILGQDGPPDPEVLFWQERSFEERYWEHEAKQAEEAREAPRNARSG